MTRREGPNPSGPCGCGERVADLLQEKGGRRHGWTITRVSVDMGVSRVVLHRWVAGQAPWPAARKTQLAELLGVDESELFEEAWVSRPRCPRPLDYVIDGDGCWIWQGRISNGRPRIGNAYAYRVFYERDRGAIPAGWHLHHVCGVPACVNPEHLELIAPDDHARLHRAREAAERRARSSTTSRA